MFEINELRGTTYATIRAAFNTSDEIMEEYGDMQHCNATGITTRVIQDVGRFSERWSSDALYGLDKIRAVAGEKFVLADGKPFDEIVCFGIRQDGVDHGDYIMQNLIKDRNPYQPYALVYKYYRRILAVRCRARIDTDLRCIRVDFSLRDITHSVHEIDAADLSDERTSKLRHLPVDGCSDSPLPQERYRIDRNDIKKAKENGFRTFQPFRIDGGQLSKDGCEGDCGCIEIRGFYDAVVPERENKGGPVCRVYAAGSAVITCWINEWYRYYDGAKDAIAQAKLEFQEGLAHEQE